MFKVWFAGQTATRPAYGHFPASLTPAINFIKFEIFFPARDGRNSMCGSFEIPTYAAERLITRLRHAAERYSGCGQMFALHKGLFLKVAIPISLQRQPG